MANLYMLVLVSMVRAADGSPGAVQAGEFYDLISCQKVAAALAGASGYMRLANGKLTLRAVAFCVSKIGGLQ